MIGYIFRNSIEILKRKPIMLWGVSLLKSIIVTIIGVVGSFVPIITIPIVQTLNAGMAALYLDGYDGREVNSKQLFRGFTKECCPRVTAGMLWYFLWSAIWGFVPIANIVKSYSYIFTPYILLTRPDISAMDALKLSMQETKGYRLKMFGANLLMALILILLIVVFALMMYVPVLGWIVGVLGIIASIILYPLFSGLVMAGFYREVQSGKFRVSYPPYGYNNPYNGNQTFDSRQSFGGADNANVYGAPNAANGNNTANAGNPVNTDNAANVNNTVNVDNTVNTDNAANADNTANAAGAQPESGQPSGSNTADAAPRKWYCIQCGTENGGETQYCKNCGKQKNNSHN